MTKLKFEELLSTTHKLQAESRKQIGQNVLDTVPLFKTLTAINKKKLLEVMSPMHYAPNSYICRQGTTGNTFFILTDGNCKVTVNAQDDSGEREVARLHPGDFFGEVALIENSNRRTANVISIDPVACLTLNRSDFNRLLKNLKVKLLEHQAIRNATNQAAASISAGEMKQMSSLSQKRRITGFNTHGQRDEIRISNLLRRFSRFITEALWNSLYSRMYREMLLDPSKQMDYGKLAQYIMKANDTRWEAVQAIHDQMIRILETDCARRSTSEHAFVFGLLKQRNQLKDKLCKNWPNHQFAILCKKVKMVRYKAFRKIIEIDSRGTAAYLIVRGAVRIFSRIQRGDGELIRHKFAGSFRYKRPRLP